MRQEIVLVILGHFWAIFLLEGVFQILQEKNYRILEKSKNVNFFQNTFLIPFTWGKKVKTAIFAIFVFLLFFVKKSKRKKGAFANRYS